MSAPALLRPKRPRALISLVPMIDVMLILLVFFMVTSTYLNLDMIPAAKRADQRADAPTAERDGAAGGGTLLIRLGADGVPVLRGVAVTPAELETRLAARLADDPLAQALVLPSPVATTQALVTVMEAATRAGVTRLRVVRLEARP